MADETEKAPAKKAITTRSLITVTPRATSVIRPAERVSLMTAMVVAGDLATEVQASITTATVNSTGARVASGPRKGAAK